MTPHLFKLIAILVENNCNLRNQNCSMKSQEKKRKQKTQLHKLVSSFIPQKVSSKKVSVKKQESSAPKNHQPSNFSRGESTGGISTAHSTKFIQQSLRTSPKASLADIKSIPSEKKAPLESKKFKIKFAEKAKDQIKKSLANVIKVYYPHRKSFLDVSMTDITNDFTSNDRTSKHDFTYIEIIGEGGFGKVWKVEYNKYRKFFAMKQMSKATIIFKKSVDNVLNQRQILQKINNPFIANMVGAFNDRDNLHLVMDLLPGGDLRYHMGQYHFSEEQSKFLIACILTALEYIHGQSIFHRDLKPENLVLDDQGYLRLTDFGIARNEREKQALDASGTPGYMAPQVICKQIHSYPVDFYAVGIISYEIMMGRVLLTISQRPYSGNNRAEIRDAILSKQHSIKRFEIPGRWSIESADFVNKLIQRVPSARLGFKEGVRQLKEHPWLRKYPWSQIRDKTIISPFRNKLNNFKITDRASENEQALMQYKLLQRAQERLDVFSNYQFRFKETLMF